MRRLQNELDDKIGKTLSEKRAAIDNGVKNGEIATPEQLDKIFRDNAAQIMKEVPALTNFAVQQLSELNSSFMNTQKELRDNKIKLDAENKDRETANNKFSSEQSVNGFAVNAGGNPMLDMNGQKIVIPKE